MSQLSNTPAVKLGVVGVSRDCFPISLTDKRLTALMAALGKRKIEAHRCGVIIENEKHMLAALDDLRAAGCNALVVYLGNFGPEGPTTQLISRFHGPAMVCAAAEENKAVLAHDRGDALCGLLNCSYNLGLRKKRAYIPERPVGLPAELAKSIATFVDVARVMIGLRNLKVFAFGPRPQDFFACNAPIQPLYDLGIEVMENSELDLLGVFKDAAGKKKEIAAVAAEMKKELGAGNTYPDLLPRLAQYEVGLSGFMADNLGARKFGVFANKCWPAFEREFGFVPCYVNGRLAGQGVPVACEVDIYGAVSEYLLQLATLSPATLLDVNNSVPEEVLPKKSKKCEPADLFMGFHCGNTCSSCMANCAMNFQVIMNRLMEDGKPAVITRGTLEGTIKSGPVTIFRLQGTADCRTAGYVAEGEIMDVDPCTFGGTGVFNIPGFGRFYRHVLIGGHFPHHTAVGFARVGEVMFECLKLLGIESIGVPLPECVPYPGENLFWKP